MNILSTIKILWKAIKLTREIKEERKMEDTKKWYTSKTIWGGLIMMVSTILQVTGIVDISPDEQSTVTEGVLGVVSWIGQLVGAVLAIYGRIKASKSIE